MNVNNPLVSDSPQNSSSIVFVGLLIRVVRKISIHVDLKSHMTLTLQNVFAVVGPRNVESLKYRTRKAQNLERLDSRNLFRRFRTRVGDPNVRESVRRAQFVVETKSLPRSVQEDAVRRIRTHFGGALNRQHFETRDHRAPRLHQIVHNHNMSTSRVSFLQLHNAVGPGGPAPFCADDRRETVVVFELFVQPRPSSLVGECDGDIVGVGEFAQSVPEQREAAHETREHGVPEVEALLHGMDVEDDEARGTAPRQGDVGEHPGQREGRCDVALLFPASRRPCGEVG